MMCCVRIAGMAYSEQTREFVRNVVMKYVNSKMEKIHRYVLSFLGVFVVLNYYHKGTKTLRTA